jgi:DNA-binding MarR family transcriptional regulator
VGYSFKLLLDAYDGDQEGTMAAATTQPGQWLDPALASLAETRVDPLDVLLRVSEVQGRFTLLVGAESRGFDLTPSEALALIALARGSLPVSGIARAVGIRPNGASVLVDRLRARRLVRRQRSRRDNRVVTVELTDEGHTVTASVVEKVRTQLSAALAPLTAIESAQLLSSLATLAT